jgi:hypothetical protein
MRTPLNISILGIKLSHEKIYEYVSTFILHYQLSYHSSTAVYQLSQHIYFTINSILELCEKAVCNLDDVLTFDKLDENKLILEYDNISPWNLLTDLSESFFDYAQNSNIDFSIHHRNIVSNSGNNENTPNNNDNDNNINTTTANNSNSNNNDTNANTPATDTSAQWLEQLFLKCDKNKITQVLRNILLNAFNHTGHNGTIQVILEHIITDTKRGEALLNSSNYNHRNIVRISIIDSGNTLVRKEHNTFMSSSSSYMRFDPSCLNASELDVGLGLWISKSELLVS